MMFELFDVNHVKETFLHGVHCYFSRNGPKPPIELEL